MKEIDLLTTELSGVLPKRRNPGSLRLRDEQRPEQQAQLSFRGSYTQEAPPQPVQDELHGLDHSLMRTTRLSHFHHFLISTSESVLFIIPVRILQLPQLSNIIFIHPARENQSLNPS